MACPLRARLAVVAATLIAPALSSGVAAASADELREVIAGLQHIPDDELPRAELELDLEATIPRRITRQEAIDDARRFFYLLSRGWCGYEYFRTAGNPGESTVDPFVEAETTVVSRLAGEQHWTPAGLSELIHERLAFVRDCHLILNDEPFCRHLDFWFDADVELVEQDGAYHFTIDGERYRLLEVEGADPGPYLFPSLNAAGEAVHLLGTLSGTAPGALSLSVVRGEREMRLERALSRPATHRGPRFAEERIGGVPVVRLGAFGDYFGRELEAIVDHAAGYRGEPYVIVDIRGNGGGNTRWPREWIQAFTGGYPSLHQALSELIGRTTMAGRANLFALAAEGYRERERAPMQAEFERFRAETRRFDDPGVRPYWSEVFVPVIRPIPNPTTLIVIQDRSVASAGEGLVSFLHNQVDNVVRIGENTKGALTFGQQSAHRLPNSKMLAYLPIKLNIQLDLEFREELGFTPDYWVPARDALNHAVAAARSGTLPTQVPLPAGYFDVEFVPERQPAWWQVHRRDLGLGAFLLVLGAVVAAVNRKKGAAVFFIAGAVALALCVGYVYFGSAGGYALGVVGLVFFAVAVVKRAKTG